MNDLSNKLSSKSIIAKQELNQADLEKRQLDLVQALEANDSYLNSEEYTQAIAEYKQMEELEKKLFREANFVLSDGRKEKLNAEGYKQGKEYDIMNGNFYCRNKKLMEFILWGRHLAKKRSIDRYHRMLFESEDTESPKLVYDCSDEDFENAFINSKRFRKGFSRDPTVKQKLDSAGYPVGNVRHTDGKHQDVSDTTIVLWSPKKGDVFMINAYKDKWGCSSHWDNSLAFPLAFPSYPS